jgi:hypothetical protein
VVTLGGTARTAWFGNLHLHSNVSADGVADDGPPERNLLAVADVAGLDFASLNDHSGPVLDQVEWRRQIRLANLWNRPGTFVVLPGYEWSSPSHGHKNVIFPDPLAAQGRPPLEADRSSPTELWEHLEGEAAITIPHHPSHGAIDGTDWSFANDERQRLVEIFQKRGNYEYDGAPYQKADTNTPFSRGHAVRDALAMGHRLGIIASPDHGGGMGLAGVWADELTRASVFEALHARRTFGTTGAKMSLFLRVAGEPQGSAVDVAPGPVSIEGVVSGTADGLALTLVSDGEELWTRDFEGREARLEWTDERPLEGTRYYYLRARQGDAHLGWTSPVWVTRGE